MTKQKARYDTRIQLYKHDQQRLKFAAEADMRTMTQLVKKIVLDYLDNFEEQTK